MSWIITPQQRYDPDAADYISRVETADGQALEASVKNLINDLFVGVKDDGIFGALKACCIMAAARTLAGALTPLLSSMPAPTNVGFVAGDYNRKTGLKGDDSTKYLNSNRNNNADPQNSKHLATWITAPASVDGGLVGSGNSAGDSHLYTGYGYFITRNNSSGVGGEVPLTSHPNANFYGTSREVSSGFHVRIDGTNYSFVEASQTPAPRPVYVFAINIAELTNARLSFYSIGEHLDLALLDARVSTFMSSLAALTL